MNKSLYLGMSMLDISKVLMNFYIITLNQSFIQSKAMLHGY